MTEKNTSPQSQGDLQFHNALLETQRETSLEGMLVVDEQGQWVSYNRRFIEMWEIPPEIEARSASELALRWVRDKVVDPEAFVERVEYLYAHREEKSQEEVALCNGRTYKPIDLKRMVRDVQEVLGA